MSFGTPLFLFLFLPLTLFLYYVTRRRLRNVIALLASIVFYIWANPLYIIPIAGLIFINYLLGRVIDSKHGSNDHIKPLVYLLISLDISVLIIFKVMVPYGMKILGNLPIHIFDTGIIAPLGLSYITFQIVAYLVDVYEGKCTAERDLISFALYVLLFPKIIAGPIALYRDMKDQLANPKADLTNISNGIRRFIGGLAKKVLIADQIATLIDPVFTLQTPSLSPLSAWFTILSYSIQLFFDFSGYTDMAIGLGMMLGYHLPENFNYPYIAKSLSDFWRRWHISLLSWLREYVFYRLEFVRRRSKHFRQQINFMIVFIIMGLWHGLTLNYVIWGAIHGFGLVTETSTVGRWIKTKCPLFSHILTLLVVIISWVFFRSPSLGFALGFLNNMVINNANPDLPVLIELQPINTNVWLALLFGIILCFPISRKLSMIVNKKIETIIPANLFGFRLMRDIIIIIIFILSVMFMTNMTYQPNIYMRF